MKTYTILFLLFCASLLTAQSQWVLYNSATSRLPNNQVFTVTVDKQNVKWIGTGFGMARLNGGLWTNYYKSNSGLPNNRVRAIAIDSLDNKWVGTEGGGLAKFDGTNWTVFNPGNSGLPDTAIRALLIDKKGVLWIGTKSKGLVSYDGTNWTVYNTSNSGLPINLILSLALEGDSVKWIGTNGGGLVRFDGTNWVFYNKHNSGSHCSTFLSIAIDSKGNKWCATFNAALERFDGREWYYYDSVSTGGAIRGHWANAVILDEQEHPWVGMNGHSMASFDGKKWQSYDTTLTAMPDTCVLALAMDMYHNKWIGTNNRGMAVYNAGGVIIPGIIQVTAPEAGAKWIGGTKQSVFWMSSNVGGNVAVKLSFDGGLTYPVSLFESTPNDGGEAITVPDTSSTHCRIKVVSLSDPLVEAINPGVFTIIGKPRASVPTMPVNQSTGIDTTANLVWQSATGAEKYRMVVAADTGFTELVFCDSTLTDTVKQLKGLTEGKKYYWRVSSLNPAGESAFSAVWSFTTMLSAPDSLKASTKGVSNIVALKWVNKTQAKASVIIERKLTGNFIVLDTLKMNETAYTDSTPRMENRYQYRLKAFTNDAVSKYTDTVSVLVTDVEKQASLPAAFKLYQNYPNPFNPSTIIRYALPSESRVVIRIYNILGEAVREIENSLKKAGYQQVSFDASSLTAGIYIYSIEAHSSDGMGHFRQANRMVLLK